MGLRAYVMWEDAGQPDGVDFGVAAEAELRSLMYAGIMPADVKLHFDTANGAPTPTGVWARFTCSLNHTPGAWGRGLHV